MRSLHVVFLALSLIAVSPGAEAGKVAVSKKAVKPVKVRRQKSRAKRPRPRSSTRKSSKAVQTSRLRRSLRRQRRTPRRALHKKPVQRRARATRGVGKGLVFRKGGLKRNVDLVIFDLDGTLAETRKDIATNFAAGFESIGVDVPQKRLLELVDGSPLHKTYWTVRPNGNEVELQRFLNGFEKSQQARGPRGTAYKGIPELLVALRKQPGIKLAVATARPADNAARLLKQMGLRKHFDIITGTHGSGMAHKPAPDMLLYVAERTGVSPKRSVFIGDTYTDMQAGKAAGMGTVAMTYGMGITKRLLGQKPDASAGQAHKLFDMFGINRRTHAPDQTASRKAPRLPVRLDVHPVEFHEGGQQLRAVAN